MVKIGSRRELLDRWRGIEEEEDDDDDPMKRRRLHKLKEEWSFSYQSQFFQKGKKIHLYSNLHNKTCRLI